jgi:hypothetical protein
MVRKILRGLFTALAWGYVIAVPLQVYFAGLGVFQVSRGFISGRSAPTFYATHMNFGWLLGLSALGMLILSPIAGFKRRTIASTGALFLLNVLQSLILWAGDGNGAIRALHPANGILIFAVALWMARSATQEYRQVSPREMDDRAPAGAVSADAPEASGANP